MKKICLTLLLAFVFVFTVSEGWGAEYYTRTLYNNKVPYGAFFTPYTPNKINVQVQTNSGKAQAVIPVVNDEEKDLTKKKGK